MKLLGPITKFAELHRIYQAVCHGKEGDGVELVHPKLGASVMFVQRFALKDLLYLDFNGLRYVQQNPKTSSEYAARARQGAKIMWIIRLSDNQYLGVVDNGQVYQKEASTSAY